MSARIDTAFILAAGLGKRLQPLTNTTPKPLLPLNGTTLIENNIKNLIQTGIKRFVINVWHLGDQIVEKLGDGKNFGAEILYSKEKVLMGTGGGLKKAFPIIDRDDFYIVNADIVCDMNYEALNTSFKQGNLASLAIRKLKTGDKHTPIKIDAGMIMDIGSGNYHYLGIGVMTKKVAEHIPDKIPSCLIRDGLIPLMNHKGDRVNVYLHDGYWFDSGTKEEYEAVKKFYKKEN